MGVGLFHACLSLYLFKYSLYLFKYMYFKVMFICSVHVLGVDIDGHFLLKFRIYTET